MECFFKKLPDWQAKVYKIKDFLVKNQPTF
jgi:hypothetical protein